MSDEILKRIQDEDVEYVDLRFTDPRGKLQHVTFDPSMIDEDFFENGTMFDGSSIGGWKAINESDMVLMPDTSTALIDPFYQQTTLAILCDVLEPSSMQPYNRDPRTTAKKAEKFLASSGIGDTAYFGPEAEFFVFDDVRWSTQQNHTFYEVDSEEGPYNSSKRIEG
ncbi:MAG: glutamine synthetase beta-grasp domain-containing protein, partial [Oceanicaulis sp.]